MHDMLIRRSRPVAAALAVLLSVAFAAPPALAAGSAAAQQPVKLTALATAKVAAMSAAELAAAQEAAPATESRSFFKTPKGVIALVLFAGATTFTFVSKSRDRVKSPIRD